MWLLFTPLFVPCCMDILLLCIIVLWCIRYSLLILICHSLWRTTPSFHCVEYGLVKLQTKWVNTHIRGLLRKKLVTTDTRLWLMSGHWLPVWSVSLPFRCGGPTVDTAGDEAWPKHLKGACSPEESSEAPFSFFCCSSYERMDCRASCFLQRTCIASYWNRWTQTSVSAAPWEPETVLGVKILNLAPQDAQEHI